MVRIPYQRVPRRPPYVSRSAADRALVATADRPSAVLVVFGEGERHGASRTLKVFVESTSRTRFAGGTNRYPVVFDMLPGSILPFAETLVQMRNLLVSAINKSFGITNIGIYLFEFDAIYTLWKKKSGIDDAIATPLTQTSRAKLGVSARKILVTMAGAGFFELVGPAKDLAEIAHNMGWGASVSIETFRETASQEAIEGHISDAQAFIHHAVAPLVSSRVKAAKAQDLLTEVDLAWLMHETLLAAVGRTQDAIRSKGLLLIAIDAIDAVDQDELDGNSQQIRSSTAGLILSCDRHGIPAVLCGRAPAAAWMQELREQKWRPERLGKLRKSQIEERLLAAKLDRSIIDLVLHEFREVEDVVAGDLDQTCRRVVKIWPKTH